MQLPLEAQLMQVMIELSSVHVGSLYPIQLKPAACMHFLMS